jgi:toxin ParE1/3/4
MPRNALGWIDDMARKKSIEFADSAVGDLEEIREWYAEQQVPDVGMRLIREIFTKVGQLSDFPDSGRIVPELGIPRLRELVYPPFRIVYRIDDTRIVIVRVWRSERLLK